jgi:hypothetical protein
MNSEIKMSPELWIFPVLALLILIGGAMTVISGLRKQQKRPELALASLLLGFGGMSIGPAAVFLVPEIDLTISTMLGWNAGHFNLGCWFASIGIVLWVSGFLIARKAAKTEAAKSGLR